MDKKRILKNLDPDDIKGFEEFIEGEPSETNFLPRGVSGNSKKNEAGFEHFTFLLDDSSRLTKLKNLLSEKLIFAGKFDQGKKLIKEEEEEIQSLQLRLYQSSEQTNSPYKKSLREIFDSFFEPPKTNS